MALGNLKIQIILSMSKGEAGLNSHFRGLVAAGTASSGATPRVASQHYSTPIAWDFTTTPVLHTEGVPAETQLGNSVWLRAWETVGERETECKHPLSKLNLLSNHSDSLDCYSMLEPLFFFCIV